jgi:integrator complex subunit 11
MKKVTSLNLHETFVEQGIKIKTYYAGHVLGACMFFIQYKDIKVVYTGDFNSCADRHLGAAWIERLHPHLLITESTYATTLRDNKRAREREFLNQI